ncbi:MAG: hypothetical protein JW932_13235 [Deltaproteobacteria bacterium]|nr:hypothetical protein [Deltaproteobacteria bacterium]
MTPLSFEWSWTADYFIFMGLLYTALIIIGCGLIYTYIKTWWKSEGGGSPPKVSYRSKYSEY